MLVWEVKGSMNESACAGGTQKLRMKLVPREEIETPPYIHKELDSVNNLSEARNGCVCSLPRRA